MNAVLLALTLTCAFQLIHGKSLTRRPQCVCSGRVTAMMQDASGTYCMYYGEGQTRQWPCENKDEWAVYLANLARTSHEPKCHCSGDVTAIMQDITGTYCVYYSENGNRKWDCENREDWELYNEHMKKENGY